MSEPDGTKPKMLVAKLAEVMAAAERVPKRGRNDFHGYDYATEADIAATIRQELAQRHVMLIPGATGYERVAVGEKGSVLTTLTMTFTFFDGESGESIERPWFGAGTDKEDKGLYKAFTGAEKYFLLKTFLMPTGDDPEREETPKRKERPASESPAGATKIASVATARGTNKKTGKPWTRYDVSFEDGRKGSTFDQQIAGRAERIKDAGVLVTPVIESDGRNQNLVVLETDGDLPPGDVEPQFDYEGPKGAPTEADRPALMKEIKSLAEARKLTTEERMRLGATELENVPLAKAEMRKLVEFRDFLGEPEAVEQWRAVAAKATKTA